MAGPYWYVPKDILICSPQISGDITRTCWRVPNLLQSLPTGPAPALKDICSKIEAQGEKAKPKNGYVPASPRRALPEGPNHRDMKAIPRKSRDINMASKPPKGHVPGHIQMPSTIRPTFFHIFPKNFTGFPRAISPQSCKLSEVFCATLLYGF